ncbi:DsbA family protein [Anaerosinus massiliensis]|uniref:DsbA family protein n=1 Tax=Massilibacillus massiliensis TaxID=1806837 RepID=UPI000DA62DA4|nr:DsbA family protein [Massilibacillus massiliensis]
MQKMLYQNAKIIFSCMIMIYACINFSTVSAQAIRGNPLAPITIVEYIDFQCPDCVDSKKIVDQILQTYDGKVQLKLKHYPHDTHPYAMSAAQVFEALARQDGEKAWEFYDLTMTEQSVLKRGNSGLQYFVDKLKLSPTQKNQLNRDLADPVIEEDIKNDMEEANKLGFHHTPNFFINGIHVAKADSIEAFSQMIDSLLISTAY